jgi:hypothetical protein
MITYDRLKLIIPADQALACKAIQVSLQQVKGISTTALESLSGAFGAIQTTDNLTFGFYCNTGTSVSLYRNFTMTSTLIYQTVAGAGQPTTSTDALFNNNVGIGGTAAATAKLFVPELGSPKSHVTDEISVRFCSVNWVELPIQVSE